MSRRALWTAMRETNLRAGTTDSELPLLSVSMTRGVLRFEDLHPDKIARADSFENYKIVSVGDLVLNRMSATSGAVGVAQEKGMVSPDYATFRAYDEEDARFLSRLVGSKGFIDAELRPLLRGIGVGSDGGVRTPRVNSSDLLGVKTWLPDLATQRRIADYLDDETREMDEMIAYLEGLVGELKQRKKAFAARLVIENDFPRAPLSTFLAMNSGDAISSDVIKDEGEYPVYGGNGLRGYTNSANVMEERILIGRQGALCGNVHRVQPSFFATEHALVVKPFTEVNLIWLEHALREMNLGELSTSVAQPGITATKVLLQRVPVPPMENQREIANQLDKETANMDAIISTSQSLIEDLKARKTALITEVVTGRKEV